MTYNTLNAGVARADITPEKGAQIAGDIGHYRPVEEVLDPLYAKALVVQAGGKRLCIVTLDLLSVTRAYADEIRDRASQQFGFEASEVMIHTLQNHSGPSLGHTFCRADCEIVPEDMLWLRGGDDDYHPVAVEGALRAIGGALDTLQPAVVGAAREIDGRAAANRRYIMRDGTVVMHPGNRPEVLCAEGPMDPEVGVVALRTTAGAPLALLLSYTSHPICHFATNEVTADWPGTWSRGMMHKHGTDWFPIVINGCCGNIAPENPLDPHGRDQERIGRLLTESASKALKRIECQNVLEVESSSRIIRIPLRPPNSEKLAEARRIIEEHPVPPEIEPGIYSREWFYALNRLHRAEVYEQQSWFDYEIQVFRIGEIALIALPGEPFVEGQLQIKLRSPAHYTYIAHMSNSYAGYIPTRQAFAAGGFETSAPGQKLPDGALSIIVEQTVQLLHEMFADIAPVQPISPAIGPPL